MKPPKFHKTPEEPSEPGQVVDTMGQAVSLSGYPLEVLKWAKKSGCPAFRGGSRVAIDELKQWISENKQSVTSITDGMAVTKEQADIRLKVLKGDDQQRKNKVADGLLIPKATVEKWMTRNAEAGVALMGSLTNELPPKLLGKSESEMVEVLQFYFAKVVEEFRKPIFEDVE